MFSQEINSHHEKLTIENLIVEIRIRANHIYSGLANTRKFEASITAGISVYSRFIRRRATNLPPDFRGFRTTLLEQFHFGVLNDYNQNFQINHRLIQYSQYRERIIILVTQILNDNRADPSFSNALLATIYDCSWCLYNYKKLPLYRTVLRDYIEDIYIEVDWEFQQQELDIQLKRFIRNLEAYINEQCTYLHFNLKTSAVQIITAVLQKQVARRQKVVMN